jgi:hypothetical protein
MRKFLLSLAIVSTALAAAPAMAQGYGQRGPEQRDGRFDDQGRGGFNNGGSRQAVFELSRDLDRIDARIERSVQRGALSRREAFGLRRDVSQVRFQLRRSQRDGIRGRELGQLRFQVAQLERRLHSERNDRDGRRL